MVKSLKSREWNVAFIGWDRTGNPSTPEYYKGLVDEFHLVRLPASGGRSYRYQAEDCNVRAHYQGAARQRGSLSNHSFWAALFPKYGIQFFLDLELPEPHYRLEGVAEKRRRISMPEI